MNGHTLDSHKTGPYHPTPSIPGHTQTPLPEAATDLFLVTSHRYLPTLPPIPPTSRGVPGSLLTGRLFRAGTNPSTYPRFPGSRGIRYERYMTPCRMFGVDKASHGLVTCLGHGGRSGWLDSPSASPRRPGSPQLIAERNALGNFFYYPEYYSNH
eukprot:754119-Hanusia_phi.AAC.1